MPGGIERAIVNMANLIQSKGHSISLFIADGSTESFYPINSGVAIYNKELNFGITPRGNFLSKKRDFVRHISVLKKELYQLNPDVIIGTEYPLTIAAYYATKNTSAKVFAWEHHHFRWLTKSRFWSYLFKRVYRKLDAVICLNAIEAKLFTKAGCRTVVIPNFASRQEQASLSTNTLLSIGWLIKRKGFDLIPAIAEKLLANNPKWSWVIVGTGEEQAAIKEELVKRNLTGKVVILSPSSPDLSSIYLSSSLYVMTSRFECFPMVLLEAMSHGIPAISFDCPTGPSSIINDGLDGFLVEPENVDAIVNRLTELMQDDEKRKQMGENAYQNISRFSPDEVYKSWQKLLGEYRSERTRE